LLDTSQVAAFFLVFLRVAAFMMSGPLFAIKGIPALLKVGFSLILAIVIFPIVDLKTPLPEGSWGFGLAVISETGVGLLLGTAVTMVLNSIKMAGQFIDLQIGYAMATLIDPASGSSSTLLSQYLYLMGLVFFLMMDGHYTLIMAIASSYELVPLSTAAFGGSVAYILLKIFTGSITIALQVSAPVLAVLLITDLVLGFLTRTTPQINVFLTGFPIKIAVGLLTLSFLIPLLGVMCSTIFNMIEGDLYSLMRELGTGVR
jgi:flagellar biosynthetic protein FliR